MIINLLWADDDCNRFLRPLGRLLLRDSRFNLIKATNYNEALKLLGNSDGVHGRKFQALLVDIILPHDAEGRSALLSNLGLTLAEKAASSGVASVAFLTVVRRDEVADKFIELQGNHQETRFTFFDKTELLSGTELRQLFDALALSD
jgi:hypothetical protein